MDTGKVLLGVLAGVAAGAVLGIIFAPAKGSETRKKIATKSKDLKDKYKDKFNEFVNTMSEKSGNVKEGVNDFATHLNYKANDVGNEMKSKFQKV